MPWVLVWDIETAAETEGFARANGFVGQYEESHNMGAGFKKRSFQKISHIGAAIAKNIIFGWLVAFSEL